MWLPPKSLLLEEREFHTQEKNQNHFIEDDGSSSSSSSSSSRSTMRGGGGGGKYRRQTEQRGTRTARLFFEMARDDDDDDDGDTFRTHRHDAVTEMFRPTRRETTTPRTSLTRSRSILREEEGRRKRTRRKRNEKSDGVRTRTFRQRTGEYKISTLYSATPVNLTRSYLLTPRSKPSTYDSKVKKLASRIASVRIEKSLAMEYDSRMKSWTEKWGRMLITQTC